MAAPSSSGVAEADLRLAALALIAEAPRHGYEIIKLLEEKTADWYLPSPNTVHPMLANLAETGYLTASPAPPRLYTITEDGRAFLQQNGVWIETTFDYQAACHIPMKALDVTAALGRFLRERESSKG